MSISNNFPSIAPSLNLNFTRSLDLDPRITFTRGSSATYTDDNGLVVVAGSNQARFDHNPTTRESFGLLIEESRVNYCQQSEVISDGTKWAYGGGSVTANATTAPDGNVTADKLTEDTSNGQHLWSQNIFSTSGKTTPLSSVFTFSCFFKSAERTSVSLTAHGEGYAVFDLSSGTVTQTGGFSNVAMTPYPNGWYRCTATITRTNTNETFYIVGWNGTNNYTGTSGSGVFAWGAQIEEGAFLTSYIPTTTASVTRSADSASITGTNFSSFFNRFEYSLFASARTFQITSYPSIVSINDGSNFTNSSSLYFDPSLLKSAMFWRNSGVQYNIVPPALSSVSNTNVKIAGSFKTNDWAVSQNGSISTQTTGYGVVPTGSTQLLLGGGDAFLNGTISQLAYYPLRLTNAQLQALTR